MTLNKITSFSFMASVTGHIETINTLRSQSQLHSIARDTKFQREKLEKLIALNKKNPEHQNFGWPNRHDHE